MSIRLTANKSFSLKKENIRSGIFFTALIFFGIFLRQSAGLQHFALYSILLFLISLRQLVLAIGQKIPILEISAVLMIGQCLISPVADYYYYASFGLNQMKVSEEIYLGYVFPALLAFYIALFLPLWNTKYNQRQILLRVREDKKKNIPIGISLIIIGLFFEYFIKHLPVPSLSFVFNTIAYFRFVGVFYLWFSGSRYTLLAIILVYVPMTLQIISGGLFLDLIVWGFFLYCFIAIKTKIKIRTTLFIFIFGFASITLIQLIKHEYRSITWKSEAKQEESNLAVFYNLMAKQLSTFDNATFKVATYAINQRANQGTIIAWELNHIPKKEDIVYGKYFFQEFLGLLLPRFLYPNKPKVGDHNKFERLTGVRLNRVTAMNVGVLGDGYGNFGYIGGIAFCFTFGLFLNFYFKRIFKLAIKYKTLPLWIPIIFFYTMRAGNEFYIIANWMIKVSVIVFLFYFVTTNTSVKRLFKPNISNAL